MPSKGSIEATTNPSAGLTTAYDAHGCDLRVAHALGGMYLRAAWISRDFKKEVLEKHYLILARDAYKTAYEKENVMSFGKFGECGLIYIIADLSLRLNRLEDALRFYSRVVQHSEIKRFRELDRMSRDGWMRVKELRALQENLQPDEENESTDIESEVK